MVKYWPFKPEDLGSIPKALKHNVDWFDQVDNKRGLDSINQFLYRERLKVSDEPAKLDVRDRSPPLL